LRKVPWDQATARDGKLILGAERLGEFQQIEKDQWPAS
jgi:hypothetical protein